MSILWYCGKMMHVLMMTARTLGVWAYALAPLLVSMTGGYAPSGT